jgi:quercetin dioxygenase-like cupin family protein
LAGDVNRAIATIAGLDRLARTLSQFARSPYDAVEENIMAKSAPEKLAASFTPGLAADLIAYQESAVVSREIVKKRTGTVTVFAFDKAQGLSEHTAPFDALVHVLDGTAEVTVGGIKHRLSKNEIILMPAHVPHALHAIERFKMLLVMIRDG